MKAFMPRKGIKPEFLANMLCGAGGELKGRVEIAGHGTCKLESEAWGFFADSNSTRWKCNAL